MAKGTIFKMTSGLNNAVEPHMLRYGEDGGCPLASCSNVFVGHTGGVRTRSPRWPVIEDPAASFWSQGNFAFYVTGGKLYRLMSDGSSLLVSSSVGTEKLSFSLFMGRVYVCNSTFRAIIDEENVYPWMASIPSLFSSDSRILGFPAEFSRCAVHAGRMCLIDGDKVWIGEPFYHACFDMGAGPLSLGSDVSGFISVGSGFYVGNATDTYFVSGGSQRDFKGMVPVVPWPIIQGTEVSSPVVEVGFDRDIGMAAVWVCQDGVYVGSPDGAIRNLTEGNLVFPKIISGSACIHDGYYIFSLEVQ